MKKTIQIFLFLLISTFVTAQEWHLEFPNTGNTTFPSSDIHKTSDGLVTIFDGKIIELNEDGSLMYDYDFLNNSGLIKNTFIEKISNSYLIVGLAGLNQSSTIITRYGFDNQVDYSISLQNKLGIYQDNNLPAAVYNSTTDEVFVGTKDSVYLMNVSNGQILWRKPSSGHFSDVMIDGNDYVAVTEEGSIIKFSDTGNVIWSTSLGFDIYAVEKTGTSSYITGGTDSNGEIRVDFVDLSGNFLSSETNGTGKMVDIKRLPDDKFITAVEKNGQVVMMKLKTIGLSIWETYHGTGEAHKVELANDGGFIILSTSSNQIVKTDSDGTPVTNKDKRFVNGFKTISISNIAAVFGADGTMFNDGLSSFSEAPKGSGVNTIFSGGLLISGYDATGNLHSSSYTAGYDGSNSEEFRKVWKINREILVDFKNDLSDGVADQPIPHDILTYPAKGNPNFRARYNQFSNLSNDAAPFVDTNNDGFYNAYDGDYPVMKGDEMLVWLMNDNNLSPISQSLPLELDLIVTVYGYECLDNSAINNNLFVHFNIINRSVEDYQDVYFGMFNDFDLGCFNDDFIGVDSSSNTAYVYNSSNIDGGTNSCISSVPTYSANIPVFASTFLNTKMDNHVYFENGNLQFNNPLQLHLGLKGQWGDGTPITASGSGYQTSGAVTTYAFHGNPSNTSDWSMCQAGVSGLDYRSIGGSGPFLMPQGQIMSFEMMYSLHENIMHPCPDISGNVVPTINAVQNYYDNDELDWEINLGLDRTIDQNSTITLNPSYANGTNYSWSTGANSPTIDITSPGVYEITVTHVNGCKKTEEVNIYGYTSTNEAVENIKTKLYPNPAKDYFQIDFEIDLNVNKLRFEMTNAIGQTLKSKTSNQSNGQITFDTSDLPTGIYFLNIKNEERHLKTLKVVVEL